MILLIITQIKEIRKVLAYWWTRFIISGDRGESSCTLYGKYGDSRNHCKLFIHVLSLQTCSNSDAENVLLHEVQSILP